MESTKNKRIFMGYIAMNPTEIETCRKDIWEQIEKVLQNTDEDTKRAWLEEYEDLNSEIREKYKAQIYEL